MKKEEKIKRARKITMQKLDEFLDLVGYKRVEINGFGYIKNNYGENTGMTTIGDRLEIKDKFVFGEKGFGTVYFSLPVCNLEYRCTSDGFKSVCLYGKQEEDIFIQIYDNRERKSLSNLSSNKDGRK